jgi:hypothetical protein
MRKAAADVKATWLDKAGERKSNVKGQFLKQQVTTENEDFIT